MTFARWLSLLLPLLATAGAAERFSFEHRLMGTRFSVVCYAENREFADRAAAIAFSKATEVDQTASDYLPDSELSRLAARPIGQPIQLSPLLYDLLAHSRRLAEATDGAFDPTLGPLTRLWRECRTTSRLPDADMLLAARSATGWRHFTLDPGSRSITLHRENMAFDLGGVAKGYAADLMLASLTEMGISKALITAGGDVRLGDAPPGKAGWRVAVQTFDPARSDEVLLLSNAAVSTSGDLHQWLEIAGVRYSHILDPASGLGLTRRIAACVIASEAKFSDALATAACVRPDASDALRKMPGISDVKIQVLPDSRPPSQQPARP